MNGAQEDGMELKHNMDYDLFLRCLTECADRIDETWFTVCIAVWGLFFIRGLCSESTNDTIMTG